MSQPTNKGALVEMIRKRAVASVLVVLALMLITQVLVIDMVRGKASLEPLGYLVWGSLTFFAAGAAWLMLKARAAGFRGAISELLWIASLGELAVTLIGWVAYYRKYR